ncbi:glycosyltransferase [Methanobacterium formicicum]|uniref:Group 1 glycosyl transferase n=1 Tax=Methanobacterium formicicum (strain DSM 3637 / PP1) TaxID=1204725 RepID=K2R1I2_METFP|nr:glycosyltransferase [Methanobacterium formicicum]EKF86363.1 group 1 glycosyl transferase [Methanobacterium formicicum DSM 3637]
MKRVLIISYSFNNDQVIGSVRMRGLAKYLKEFGWNPTILTVKSHSKSSEFDSVETNYEEDIISVWKKKIGFTNGTALKGNIGVNNNKNKKSFLNSFVKFSSEIVTYPDTHKGWLKPALESGNKLLKENKFDAIVSTYPVATCHLIAKKLSENHDLPWIADYRDLWSQNHYKNYSKIRKHLDTKLEIKTLKSAKAITTISDPLKEKLNEIHNDKEIYTIMNGFDPKQINPGTEISKKFSITYTGTLYNGIRDPEPLLISINELITDGIIDPKDMKLQFYGPKEDWLEKDIEKNNLSEVTEIFGEISRDLSIQKQREAQLLLLITANDPREKGFFTGKLFDYLAAERPIFHIGVKNGVIEKLLKKTNTGISTDNINDIKLELERFYGDYIVNKEVSYHGLKNEVNKYNHKSMAKKFSDILDSL